MCFAGARFGKDFDLRSGLVVSPWVTVGEIAYTGDRNQNLNVTLGSVHEVLPASGAPANAGVALMHGQYWSVQLVYRGQFSSHT